MKTDLQGVKGRRSVSIVSYADLAADPDAWDALMGRALTTHPHYSRHVMAAHRIAGLADASLAFVAVRGPGGLDALLPFGFKRDVSGLGSKVARPFLSPFITQTSPLVADDPDLPEILDLLVTGLRSASEGRVWRWPLLPTSTKLGGELLAAMDRAGWQYGIAHRFERPILERRTSHAAFLAGHPHRSRMKDLRRRHRRLSKRGTVSLDVATHGQSLRDAVAGFLALERAGWKGRAGTALSCRPQHEAFARALFADANGPVGLRADTLRLDGRPLSISLALLAGGTATLLKTTYDETERSSAPGLVLEAQIIATLHETEFARRLDSATLAGSVLEDVFPDRETICEIVAAPSGASRLFPVDPRIRLAMIERDAKALIKRILGRR
ncbi:GNAT family N-acetyltransferase [Methylobacterium sp. E-045]|uniref:GNAT family N-acetyltransferase n=1 Tax=Methylobacterium sp. E-045 TaxID=2836575 RepID=UPI001FB91832|nr:GNAT family N-acetyltransferase [Methylobacterium sp. E-045]MCJ2128382.1 GNAT family N-acetyltransferase [Methylobacterium sp. E-045]